MSTCKKFFKKFLNSIKLFLLFSTEISSTEYRDVAYVQYRDVQVPRCPDTVLIPFNRWKPQHIIHIMDSGILFALSPFKKWR